MAWVTPRTWLVGEMVTAALMNTHLRDNLLALKNPPRANIVLVNTGWATTSTSFVTVTGAVASVTTKGGRLMIAAFGTLYGNTTLTAALSLLIDGARQGNTVDGLQRVYVTGSTYDGFGFFYLSPVLAAAAHTVTLQVKTSTGSLGVLQVVLWAQET